MPNSQELVSLRAFVDRMPFERKSTAEFVERVARDTPSGSRVLDAGAGDAPYRPLFSHCRYETTDWENSPHEGARQADYIASLDEIPVPDESFDLVLCTQVLEHLADPGRAIAEFHRILRPSGVLALTAPLINELHEEPFDFFRYTPYGLETLLRRAGFSVDRIEARTSYFVTLAHLLGWSEHMCRTPGEHSLVWRFLGPTLRAASRILAGLDRLDRRRILPLGYAVLARRPLSDEAVVGDG